MADENDAITLLRPDVGAWFALGGNAVLQRAGDDLEELRASRAARRGENDGVVTAIIRAAGIDAGRDVLRYKAGKFRRTPGDRDQAAKLLSSLGKAALRTFDAQTAAGTQKLAATYAKK